MSPLLSAVSTVNAYMSDYILVTLLLGIGIYYSFRTRFVQVRCFGHGLGLMLSGFSLSGEKSSGGLSSFQALTAAIAAQVGTGNIVGASGAILVGGPGAIFWMWVIAFFGMATIYAEAALARTTCVRHDDGTVSGGPAWYIKLAFPGHLGRVLAGLFAVATISALGVASCMIQTNAIAATFHEAFSVPRAVMGCVSAALAAFIFLGGVGRIASVTEKLVPFMAMLYLLGGAGVLLARAEFVPEAIGIIFHGAFAPQAVIGGSFGHALKISMSQGAKRGLFSNEAGMGSTPHAHALADAEPHDQGCVAMIGVFVDTFIVLTMTALVVISVFYTGGADRSAIDSSSAAQLAFASVYGDAAGEAFVAVCIFFFAFSTLLCVSYYGMVNARYLFGDKSRGVYIAFTLSVILCGALISSDLIWELSDLFNGLMVLPNVAALAALSRIPIGCSLGRKV